MHTTSLHAPTLSGDRTVFAAQNDAEISLSPPLCALYAGAQVGVGGGRQKVRALPAVDEGAEGMIAARQSERGDTQKGRWRERRGSEVLCGFVCEE